MNKSSLTHKRITVIPFVVSALVFMGMAVYVISTLLHVIAALSPAPPTGNSLTLDWLLARLSNIGAKHIIYTAPQCADMIRVLLLLFIDFFIVNVPLRTARALVVIDIANVTLTLFWCVLIIPAGYAFAATLIGIIKGTYFDVELLSENTLSYSAVFFLILAVLATNITSLRRRWLRKVRRSPGSSGSSVGQRGPTLDSAVDHRAV